MVAHPVQLHVEPGARMDRTQVAVRVVLLLALGAIGCSSFYWVLYLALPAFAAVRVAQKKSDTYLLEDAPRIIRVLRWLAGAYAYLWLLTDSVPSSEPSRAVDLDVEPGGSPTSSSALLKLLTSLPAIVLLAIFGFVAGLMWPIGAILILVNRRLPAVLHDYFATTLRYQFRLAAYHLSLVDRYPSLEEVPISRDATHAGTV
jgi:Domain of unknown function (DUF4389)